MGELRGKVALVTGSSRGIGRGCALRLAEEGAHVVVNFVSNQHEAERVLDTIKTRYYGDALCLQADIRKMADVQRMYQTILDRWGKLDILVNNAGIYRDNLLLRMREEEWQDVLQTNLTGMFHCTKLAVKQMLKQKQGKIINITSVVGQIGNEGQANYATAKAGIIGFTRTMALELASRQITVNAVAPGYIESEMTEGLTDTQRVEILKKIPFNRFGECSEVAEVVLFLSSDRCRYMTGQTINVDGGMVMK